MGPIASTAARSASLALSSYFIMSATWCALITGASLQYKIGALGIMLTKPAWWAIALLAWLGLFAWMSLGMKPLSNDRPSRWAKIGWWIGSTLAAAVAMVALTQGVSEVQSLLINGTRFPSTSRSVERLFEAALFAVVVLRIALPLTPRFDRMPPRNA